MTEFRRKETSVRKTNDSLREEISEGITIIGTLIKLGGPETANVSFPFTAISGEIEVYSAGQVSSVLFDVMQHDSLMTDELTTMYKPDIHRKLTKAIRSNLETGMKLSDVAINAICTHAVNRNLR